MGVRFQRDLVLGESNPEFNLFAPSDSLNWDTFTNDSAVINMGTFDSSGAQNDYIEFETDLPPGVYSFRMIHVKGADRGQYYVAYDGNVQGIIDGYNATTSKNVVDSIASINILDGRTQSWRLTMQDKNASSSSYVGSVVMMGVFRTGDV